VVWKIRLGSGGKPGNIGAPHGDPARSIVGRAIEVSRRPLWVDCVEKLLLEAVLTS
jgi:hypothetical protein